MFSVCQHGLNCLQIGPRHVIYGLFIIQLIHTEEKAPQGVTDIYRHHSSDSDSERQSPTYSQHLPNVQPLVAYSSLGARLREGEALRKRDRERETERERERVIGDDLF